MLFKDAVKSVLRILSAHNKDLQGSVLQTRPLELYLNIANGSYLYVNLFCLIELKFQCSGPQQKIAKNA